MGNRQEPLENIAEQTTVKGYVGCCQVLEDRVVGFLYEQNPFVKYANVDSAAGEWRFVSFPSDPSLYESFVAAVQHAKQSRIEVEIIGGSGGRAHHLHAAGISIDGKYLPSGSILSGSGTP